MLNSNSRPSYILTSMIYPDICIDFIPIKSPLRILPSWLSEFDKLFFYRVNREIFGKKKLSHKFNILISDRI